MSRVRGAGRKWSEMLAGAELLRVENLGVGISLQFGQMEAVKSASLRVLPGKVTALVGESGSGKSIIAQAIMGILPRVAQIRKGQIRRRRTPEWIWQNCPEMGLNFVPCVGSESQ
jgi:ABC-type glutathione transport system ATPase component